jgi:hypothetical protein
MSLVLSTLGTSIQNTPSLQKQKKNFIIGVDADKKFLILTWVRGILCE